MRLAVERLGYKQALLGCLRELGRLATNPGKEQLLSHYGFTTPFAYFTCFTCDRPTLAFRSRHLLDIVNLLRFIRCLHGEQCLSISVTVMGLGVTRSGYGRAY